MIDFDIVITTYNRPKYVERLVNEIRNCDPGPKNIIIVDSSETLNPDYTNKSGIVYIHSSHKNQPYQRILGAQLSTSQVICFFDDDLTISNKALFKHIDLFKDREVQGVSYQIVFEGNGIPLAEGEGRQVNKLKKLVWQITGVSFPKSGDMTYFGNCGAYNNQHMQEVRYFRGPNMCFRTESIKKFHDKDLFDMFEHKMGMGEDKAISYSMSKLGKLIYVNETSLIHPENVSTYYLNFENFTCKVIYSRKYLNTLYAKLNNKSILLSNIHYYWYALCRLMAANFAYIKKPSNINAQKLTGTFKGIFKSIFDQKYKTDFNWHHEIKKDLDNKDYKHT